MLTNVGEWSRTDGLDMGVAADRAERALTDAARLGAKGASGRFVEYLPLLREASTWKSSPVPWPAGSRERALFFEGATQVRHLLKAAEVWPLLPPTDAKHKLTKALAGNAIPDPKSDVDRQARDFMLEFSTAWAFTQRPGMRVSMPNETGREDVRAVVPGVGELVVECKRPQSVKTFPDKLREAGDKLRQACDGTTTIGMVVLGIDRVIDGAVIPARFTDLTEIPSFSDHASLHWWIEHEFRARIADSVVAEAKARRELFPEIPFVGLLMTAQVFVHEDAAGGLPYMLDYLAIYNTGESSWEKLESLKAAFFGA